jgi:hypothetical protein
MGGALERPVHNEVGCECVECNLWAQDGIQWLALLNAVTSCCLDLMKKGVCPIKIVRGAGGVGAEVVAYDGSTVNCQANTELP